MAFDFGQLSFRQGTPKAVGLPLEVIDKVGTTLTQKYHQNRSAYSAGKEKVLNLPDSNSEGNRKIISQITDGIKQDFAEFEKEGNWWEADDAVYKMADKITSSQEVKDLIKYNAQYAKVDDQIEKSGASEFYKNIRRQMNQSTNYGIRDEKGNALSYQGRGLAGDLDMSKYIKTINDLVSGWKADVQTKINNPQMFNAMKTSDGYNVVAATYGTDKIESVSEDEVRSLVMATMLNDPKFNAEVNDIAELDLFYKTRKLNPTKEDVTNIMLDQSKSQPYLTNMIIAGSDEFVKETEKMDVNAKNKYLLSILNNKESKDKYIASGVNSIQQSMISHYGESPEVYKGIYTNFVRMAQLTPFEGLIDKASYTAITRDFHFNELSLNGKMYENHLKALDGIPITHVGGQVNTGNASKYLDVRNETSKMISRLEAERDASKDEGVRKLKNEQIDTLKSKQRANDAYINAITGSLGITEEDVVLKKKEDIKSAIRNIISPYSYSSSSSGAQTGALKYTPKDIEDIYNIVSKNYRNSNGIKEALSKKGYDISKYAIDEIARDINIKIKDVVSTELANFKGDMQSIPFEGIGYIGADPKVVADLKTFFAKEYSSNNGTFNIVDSWDKDRIGTTNAGENFSHLFHTEKIKGVEQQVKNNIDIEPVIMNKDDLSLNQSPMFQITITDPISGGTKTEIVQYNGPIEYVKDMFSSTVISSAKSALDPNNRYPSIARRSAYVMAGQYVANNPLSSIDGENASGHTLGNYLSTMRPHSEYGGTQVYPTVSFKYGDRDLTLSTVRGADGKFVSNLYSGKLSEDQAKGANPILQVPSGTSPSTILQYIGADMIRREALARQDADAYVKISNLFDLTIPKSK